MGEEPQEARVEAPDCRSNLNRLIADAVLRRSVSLRCRTLVADRPGWHREPGGGRPCSETARPGSSSGIPLVVVPRRGTTPGPMYACDGCNAQGFDTAR